MRLRYGAFIALVIAIIFPVIGTSLLAQSRTAKPWTAARTPEGKPDLQGNWSFAVITPFERPPAFGDKATLSDQEVAG